MRVSLVVAIVDIRSCGCENGSIMSSEVLTTFAARTKMPQLGLQLKNATLLDTHKVKRDTARAM